VGVVVLGFGVGGLAPNPQTPIPNPQSPIPNPQFELKNNYKRIIKFNNHKIKFIIFIYYNKIYEIHQIY